METITRNIRGIPVEVKFMTSEPNFHEDAGRTQVFVTVPLSDELTALSETAGVKGAMDAAKLLYEDTVRELRKALRQPGHVSHAKEGDDGIGGPPIIIGYKMKVDALRSTIASVLEGLHSGTHNSRLEDENRVKQEIRLMLSKHRVEAPGLEDDILTLVNREKGRGK